MLKNLEPRFSGFAVKTSSDPRFFFTHSLDVFNENFICGQNVTRNVLRMRNYLIRISSNGNFSFYCAPPRLGRGRGGVVGAKEKN